MGRSTFQALYGVDGTEKVGKGPGAEGEVRSWECAMLLRRLTRLEERDSMRVQINFLRQKR